MGARRIGKGPVCGQRHIPVASSTKFDFFFSFFPESLGPLTLDQCLQLSFSSRSPSIEPIPTKLMLAPLPPCHGGVRPYPSSRPVLYSSFLPMQCPTPTLNCIPSHPPARPTMYVISVPSPPVLSPPAHLHSSHHFHLSSSHPCLSRL